MPGWFEPIVPKKKQLVNTSVLRTSLTAEMKYWTGRWAVICATYEVPSTTTVRPSRRRGRRAYTGYRRTGLLARSWNKTVSWQGNNLIGQVWVSSANVPYAVYVRGPKEGPKGQRQAARMAARGWRSVDDIITHPNEWPQASRRFREIIKKAGNK